MRLQEPIYISARFMIEDITKPNFIVGRKYKIKVPIRTLSSEKFQEVIGTLIQQTEHLWAFTYKFKGITRTESISKKDYLLSNKNLVKEL